MKKDFTFEYIYPVRALAMPQYTQNIAGLFRERLPQAGLDATNLTIIKGAGKLVLDYGKEIQGGLKLVTHTVKCGEVIIRFGESVNEAVAPIGYKNSCNDHSARELKISLQNYSQTEFANTGFRFVCIEFCEQTEIELKAAVAVFRYRNITQRGKFECDDELVNKIYDTASYTCRLCMQEMLWDGIKRDRLVWMGDMHPETLSINCLFGGDETVKDALEFSKAEYPLPQFMNFMPSYSMWYVLILKDYFMQTGDMAYLEKNLDYLAGVLELFDEKTMDEGSLTIDGFFLDWPSSDTIDAETGVKALLLMAANAGKYLLTLLGADTSCAQRIISKLKKASYPVKTFKQAAAFKYLCGVAANYNPAKFLTHGGANGLSTFTAYYVLKSIAQTQSTNDALSIMKEYFGGMLSRGATTFWEDFDVNWLNGSGSIDEFTAQGLKDLHGDFGGYCYKGFRHSLCHGWASGAVPFLTEKVLGVKILEPGCNKLEISGDLGALKFARGIYPTNKGDVKIFREVCANGVRTHVDAPNDIDIIIINH